MDCSPIRPSCRHRRCTARCPISRRCSPPIARPSKRRSQARGRAPPSPRSPSSNSIDYACPYCKASNPHVDQLLKEDKGLRVVYRELPILGPDSLTAARLSLEASKAGRFAQFHDAHVGGRPPRAGHDRQRVAAAGIAAASSKAIRRSRPSSSATSSLPASSARPARRCSSSATRVMNGAVGYDAQGSHRQGAGEEPRRATRRRAPSRAAMTESLPSRYPALPLDSRGETSHRARVATRSAS